MQNNKETANATPKYQTIFVAHALHTQQKKNTQTNIKNKNEMKFSCFCTLYPMGYTMH